MLLKRGHPTSTLSLGGVLRDVSGSDEGVLGRSGRLGGRDRAGGDGGSPIGFVNFALFKAMNVINLLDDVVGHKLVAIDC